MKQILHQINFISNRIYAFIGIMNISGGLFLLLFLSNVYEYLLISTAVNTDTYIPLHSKSSDSTLCNAAHPNIRLFITHGGLLSTQEAVSRGVPLLGIPIFADQHMNMRRTVAAGLGLMIEWNNITTDSLTPAIREVTENPK
jgi:UDP:flavonoid glycosyltransferase YjiC (YdhE family)